MEPHPPRHAEFLLLSLRTQSAISKRVLISILSKVGRFRIKFGMMTERSRVAANLLLTNQISM